ncbi:MAG: TetR/AcrR family transcriptional regulator [Parvibaculaceae bacterium]|nr:TetR/AcrR family transcriptional regulator [Parvibaculaceae bacterium]
MKKTQRAPAKGGQTGDLLEKKATPQGVRAKKRAQTIERILEEANALLKEERFSGFSLRKLAGRMGLRLSHIQHYFPQSTDLLAALFERFIAKDSDEFLTHFEKARGGPEARLRMALQNLLADDAYLDGCELFMSEMGALAKQDERIATAVQAYFEAYHSAVDTLLRTLNPDLTPALRREKAVQIVALIEGTLRIRVPLERRHKGRVEKLLTQGILNLAQG